MHKKSLVFILLVFLVTNNKATTEINKDHLTEIEAVNNRKTFDDFIGHDEIIKQAKNFVQSIKNCNQCERIRAQVLQGLVIKGPASNGKTLLAHIIASELSAHLIEASAGKSLDLENLFYFAKQKLETYKTVVLLIKDIEHLNNQKTLIKELSNSQKHKNLIVIVKLEDKQELSQDITEEKLFTLGMEKIKIFFPNKQDREKLLFHFFETIKLKKESSSEAFASEWSKQITDQKSAAFFKNFVSHAALIAIQEESNIMLKKHCQEAFLKLYLGSKCDYVDTEEEQKIIATHEAGHALAYILCGYEVKFISSIPRETGDGVTYALPQYEFWPQQNKNEMLLRLIGDLGGFCAEKILIGAVTGGPAADLQKVDDRLFSMIGKYGMGQGIIEGCIYRNNLPENTKNEIGLQINKLRLNCLNVTTKLLKKYKTTLLNLVNNLLKEGILYEKEIYTVTGKPRDEATALLIEQDKQD